MVGVVVAIENEDMLVEALQEDQYITAEREHIKKQERLFKNWKKLLNSLKIQDRVQREYGEKQRAVNEEAASERGGRSVKKKSGKGDESAAQEERQGDGGEGDLEVYRDADLTNVENVEQPAGGFMVD